VRFDRASSFVNRPNNRPCVLLDDGGGNAALRQCQNRLAAAFGAGRSHAFTPHLTLLYDDRVVVEEVVTPVSWMAAELVLVHSVVGEGHYDLLDRWAFQG